MSNHHRIDYLELPAKDIEAAQAFYGRVFGFTFVAYGPDYLSFSDGTMNGGFYRADLASTTYTGGALIVLFSEDLEATQARVEHHGGTIVKPTAGGSTSVVA